MVGLFGHVMGQLYSTHSTFKRVFHKGKLYSTREGKKGKTVFHKGGKKRENCIPQREGKKGKTVFHKGKLTI